MGQLKDDILLRLPNNLHMNIKLSYEFLENYKREFNIVDARIENQIILNE